MLTDNERSMVDYFTDAHYDSGVWSVVDRDTGERHVDLFRGDISSLVSEENQRWCQINPNRWLHEKFGDGRVHAVKRVSHGFVKVWIGEKKGLMKAESLHCVV